MPEEYDVRDVYRKVYNEKRLDDESLMPFGKHKGKLMIDVPDNYLIFLYQSGLKPGNVKDYIEDVFSPEDLKLKE